MRAARRLTVAAAVIAAVTLAFVGWLAANGGNPRVARFDAPYAVRWSDFALLSAEW